LLRPLVIALHGAVVNAASWIPVEQALGDSVEFIAPDLPGHGTQRDRPFTIDAARTLVDDILTNQPTHRRIVMIGDSLGGYLAVLIAAQASTRVHAVVAGGTTFDVRGFGGVLLTCTDLLSRGLERCIGPEASAAAFERMLHYMTDTVTAEAIQACGLRFAARTESIAELRQVDIQRAVRAYTGYLYLVNGSLDIPIVWHTKTFARMAPRGSAFIIPGAWHGCAVSRPREFADIVRTAIATT